MNPKHRNPVDQVQFFDPTTYELIEHPSEETKEGSPDHEWKNQKTVWVYTTQPQKKELVEDAFEKFLWDKHSGSIDNNFDFDVVTDTIVV